MYRFLILTVFSFFLAQSIISQETADNNFLLKIGKTTYPSDEFMYLYEKNNGSEYVTEKLSVDEYLELYINYKLKVKAAENEGLHKDQKFYNEYSKYLKMLTDPYLSDSEADSSLLRETYNRMKEEVRSSHILVKVPEDAPPADTLAAYKRAMRIRSRLLKGEDFAKVAKMTSDDNSAKSNGGDIGYITAFQAVYPYESFIFNSEPGKISMPFRSQWGFHIVKVTDRRKIKPDCQMQHIMIKPASVENLQSVTETMDSIYAQLQNGADFEELAEKYSSEENIRKSRGNMGWISYSQFERTYQNRYPTEFIQKAFEIKKGEISKPFSTKWGVHIVKILDTRDIAPYEKLMPMIKQKMRQFPDRSGLSKIALIEKLKEKYKPIVDYKNFTKLAEEYFDSSLVDSKWMMPNNLPEETVLTIGETNYSFKEFAVYADKFQRMQKRLRDVLAYANILFEDYISNSLIEAERKQVLQNVESVKYLANEYYDGMLLFSISDSLVWSKANTDTAGLEAFYETVKNNYMWGKRVSVAEYSCLKDLDAAYLKKLLIKKQKKGWSDEKAAAIYKKKKKNDLVIAYSKHIKGEMPAVDDIGWDSKAVFDSENGTVIEVKDVIADEPKLLSEIRGEVISKYQEKLEKDWVAKLRKEINFSVNEKQLKLIKEKYKK